MRPFVERVKADAAAMLNPEPPDAGRHPSGLVYIRQGESLVFRLRLDRYRQTARTVAISSDRTDSMRYIVPPASYLDRTHAFRVTRVRGRGVPGTRRVGLEEAVRMSDGQFVRLDLPPITFSERGPVVLRFTARLPNPPDLERVREYPRGHLIHAGLPYRIRHYWLDFEERFKVLSDTEWQRRHQILTLQRSRRSQLVRYYNRTNYPRTDLDSGARTRDREVIALYARLGLNLAGDSNAETTANLERFLAFDRLNQSLIALDEIREQMQVARGRVRVSYNYVISIAPGAPLPNPESQPEATPEEVERVSLGIAEILLGMIPVIGDLIGIVETVMGRTFLTGEELSAGERAFIGGASVFGLLSVFGGVLARLTRAVGEATITAGRLVARLGRRGARAFRAAVQALGGSAEFGQFSRLLRRVARGQALGNTERNFVLSYLRRLEDLLIAGHTGAARTATDRVGQAAFDEAARHIPAEEIGRAFRGSGNVIRIPGLDNLQFQVVVRNGRRFLAVCQ